MSNDCDIQLDLKFVIPPRTKLFCLEPMGVGTCEIESFPSWLTRLARAHRISTRKLLLQVLPDSEIKITPNGRRRLRVNLFNSLALLLPYLSKTTGRKDLGLTTLDRCFSIFPKANLLRKHRAWCPDCLRESPHERLSWTIKLVTVCLKHHSLLQEKCPGCHKTIPPLRLGSCIDYCPNCGLWLCVQPHKVEKTSSWETHTADEIGSLLSKTKFTENPNPPKVIAEGLRGLLPTWTQEEICRLLGVNNNCFALLRKRNKRVPLHLLCKISFTFGIPLRDLMFLSIGKWEVRWVRKQLWKAPTRELIHTNRKRIKTELKKMIRSKKLSLRMVSLILGHSRAALTRNFPKETTLILTSTPQDRIFPLSKSLKCQI